MSALVFPVGDMRDIDDLPLVDPFLNTPAFSYRGFRYFQPATHKPPFHLQDTVDHLSVHGNPFPIFLNHPYPPVL